MNIKDSYFEHLWVFAFDVTRPHYELMGLRLREPECLFRFMRQFFTKHKKLDVWARSDATYAQWNKALLDALHPQDRALFALWVAELLVSGRSTPKGIGYLWHALFSLRTPKPNDPPGLKKPILIERMDARYMLLLESEIEMGYPEDMPLVTEWDKRTYERDIHIDRDGTPDPDISWPIVKISGLRSDYRFRYMWTQVLRELPHLDPAVIDAQNWAQAIMPEMSRVPLHGMMLPDALMYDGITTRPECARVAPPLSD